MFDHLSDLRLFTEIIRRGNISEAGKSLNLSPAVASKRLQRLEDSFKIQLVHRTTRRVSSTQAGQDFYEKAIDILEQVDELAVLSGDISPHNLKGHLRISSPVSFGKKYIAPCISSFLSTYVNMQINLVLDDMRSDMLSQGVDLAVSIAPLKQSNFIVRRLVNNRKILVASPEYAKKYGYPENVQDLAKHNCLVLGDHKNWNLIHCKSKKEESIKVKSNFSSNSGQATIAAAKSGLGICVKSWWDITADLDQGKLVQILPDYEMFSDVGISIIYPSKRHLPTKTRIMLDFLVDYVRKKMDDKQH